MKTLSFTHQYRRSTKTLRLQYGLEGMKYIVQVYEGEINGHGEKEGLPIEYQYEFEQEMLKHIHYLKNEIREKGWWEREIPDVSQTSLFRKDFREDEISFRFESHDFLTRLSIIIVVYFINCSIFEAQCIHKPLRITL